jgi:hypothetical protein
MGAGLAPMKANSSPRQNPRAWGLFYPKISSPAAALVGRQMAPRKGAVAR